MNAHVQIPAEFAYWQNIDKPRHQRRRKAIKGIFGVDPQLPDDKVRLWAQSYYDADPVAEAFVEEVYMKRGQAEGRKMVDQALDKGAGSVSGAPASLRKLFDEFETDPDWLDRRLVEQGARVFRRFGTHMFSYAGAVTLEGYWENSVAKPLAFTGAYTGESANRRFLETCGFWIDVAQPGAMFAGGQGRKTAMRVRLMHVFVRKRLLQHPQWDLAAWGVPISQGDALLTLLAGSVVPGTAFKAMGYRTSDEEILAMMHFWRYIGHIMGVQPRFHPSTIQEAMGIMFASTVKGVRKAGEDARNLAHSYVESYAPREDQKGLERILQQLEYWKELGYTRFFLPGKTYTDFDLPRAGLLRLYPLAQAPFILAREGARRYVPGADDLYDRAIRWYARKWLDRHLGPRRAEYKAVEEFTR